METKDVSVRLFGVFRDFEPRSIVRIEASLPLSVGALKEKLAENWLRRGTLKVDVRALLKSSALATNQKVLRDEDLIETADALALLPPVCGG